jgi:hypothetical protein
MTNSPSARRRSSLAPGERSLAPGALKLVPALLATALAIHFTMTAIYLIPVSPAKLRLAPLAHAYMFPFFAQDWHLFAPEPESSTRVWMVSCRIRGPEGATRETPWADITTPYRQAHYRSRFGSADRLLRTLTSAGRLTYTMPPSLAEFAAGPTNEGDGELTKAVDIAQERSRQEGIRALNRVASAHCDQMHGPADVEAVRVRMAILRFPRFSRRHLPDSAGELSMYDYDWAPHEDVAPQEIRQ